jgi:cytochrome b
MSRSQQRTLVWDLPTRTFHWLLAASFAGAFVTADSERLRDVHMVLGYTTLGLVAFRLLWGIVGTRYARFTALPLSPAAVIDYLKSLLKLSPRHYFGHNPAGSWAIVAMLLLVVALGATGWAQAVEIGPEWLEDLHEGLANATLALVVVHVVAVLVSSALHRENLPRAMVTGYKPGAGPAATGTRWAVALLLVAAVGAFWAGDIPAPGLEPGRSLVQAAVQPGGAAVGERMRRRRGEGADD